MVYIWMSLMLLIGKLCGATFAWGWVFVPILLPVVFFLMIMLLMALLA